MSEGDESVDDCRNVCLRVSHQYRSANNCNFLVPENCPGVNNRSVFMQFSMEECAGIEYKGTGKCYIQTGDFTSTRYRSTNFEQHVRIDCNVEDDDEEEGDD